MQCMNPKARECKCFVCESEIAGISVARNRVAYTGIRNSIVEWMLSDAWVTPSEYQDARGSRNGFAHNEVSGEIS